MNTSSFADFADNFDEGIRIICIIRA